MPDRNNWRKEPFLWAPSPSQQWEQLVASAAEHRMACSLLCDPSIWEIGTGEVQGHPQQVSELKASLGYRRPVGVRQADFQHLTELEKQY